MQPSEATRYLCAAAYLDGGFAEKALRQTIYERHRAVATSPGVELVPVLGHCVAARNRRTVRDLILAIAVATLIVALVTGRPRLLVLTALLSWFVVLTETATARYDVVGTRLARGSLDIHPRSTGSRTSRMVREAGDRVSGNVTVYSGFSPFVGSGLALDGWSFALNVRKGKESLTGRRATPREFAVTELYDAVGRELSRLRIRGLSLQDRLFVHGQDVRQLSELLPDPYRRPVSDLPLELVRQYRDGSDYSVRHYLSIQIEDWRGELVLSMFFRLRRVSETLFMETSFFLLPPLTERRHEVDSLQSTPTVREVTILVGKSILHTISGMILAYPRLISRMLDPVNRRAKEHAERLRISSDAVFDYGAQPTIREQNTAIDYRRYFQRLDKEMYAKTVERTLLDVVSSFLDDHDIDTSTFDERRSTILNNGVMVTGGSFAAENVAAGNRSTASSRRRNNTPGGSPDTAPTPTPTGG